MCSEMSCLLVAEVLMITVLCVRFLVLATCNCVMHCEICQSMLTTLSQAGAHAISGHFLFDYVTVSFLHYSGRVFCDAFRYFA